MAKHKEKAKSKNIASGSKGVVGRLKNIIRREPKAAASKPKAAPGKTKKSKAKPAAAPKTTAARKNGASAAQAPEPNVPVKRKPPSITITRPEVTRPPLVQMPTPKNEPPIGAPNILVPKGGLPVNSLTPSLRWMYVGGATRYEVEWSSDNHFGRGHGNSMVSAQTLVTLDAAHALKPGLMYQWRVRGGNDSGWGPWSGAESFKAPDKV